MIPMKTVTIKVLMLLTLVISSLHGASYQRLLTPARTYAGTYWQQQAPRLFSSSRYVGPTADEIKAAEKARHAKETYRKAFIRQYFDTVREKVGNGRYKEYSEPLRSLFYFNFDNATRNMKTLSIAELAQVYADIMVNGSLSPQERILALKELSKDQGRHIAAELQLEKNRKAMQNVLEQITSKHTDDWDRYYQSVFSSEFAKQQQFGNRPNATKDLMNYVTKWQLENGAINNDIYNRSPAQREFYKLLLQKD